MATSWYLRNKERVGEVMRARRRAWYAANRDKARAAAKVRGDHRDRGDRTDYMRQWWADLKANDPIRHAQYMARSNKRRAINGLPESIHEMRLVLFEFRSRLHRDGREA